MKNKKITIAAVIFGVIIGIGIFLLVKGHFNKVEIPQNPDLTNSGLTENTIIKYFGNEAYGDLNSDGLTDKAYITTEDPGGSGTFYYVIVALKNPAPSPTPANDYHLTNPVFIGDRIAPQSTEITNGVLFVNYADRSPSEPMSTPPSHGVTLRLKVNSSSVLEEVK